MSFTSLISFLDSGDWVVATFLGAFALCIIVARWVRLNMQVEGIPSIKDDIKKMQVEDIPAIKTDISKIGQDVAELKGNFNAFTQGKSVPAIAQSPIHLTDYGREIFDAIGGDELIKKYADRVVFPENPNAYQIQEACRFYILTELMNDLNSDERGQIELYAYNKGDPIEFPLRVMWISMRDYWLEKKGIPTDDVDNHAPEAG